jgi:hypothetical protein
MRSGASHPGPHLSCVPDLPLSPRRRRHERFSPITPAQASASFAEAQLQTSHFAMTDPQLCGWPAACLLLRRATRGRRPQCPGNQSRSARFWKFPPAIHSRELPVTADSAAITWPVRNSHVSLITLSVRLLQPATQKALAIVQKLWTSRLPCGSHWKSKTES